MQRLDGSRSGNVVRKPGPGRGRTGEILAHPGRVFEGARTAGRIKVWVHAPLDGHNKAPLPPRHDLWDHSPTGYEWGYPGSGPAQLALALLANVLHDDDAAVRLHQCFKRRVIVALDEPFWALTLQEVWNAVAFCLDSVDEQARQEGRAGAP